MAANAEEVYRSLNADDDEIQPMELESVCMNCFENASVSFLLTLLLYRVLQNFCVFLFHITRQLF